MRRRTTKRSVECSEVSWKRQLIAFGIGPQIFRRLVVYQRGRAHHAQMVSHEVETGGSDTEPPEFWDDDLGDLTAEQALAAHHEDFPMSPKKQDAPPRKLAYRDRGEDDERWANEAAEAELAEREVEEAEIARRIEEAYGIVPVLPTMTKRDDQDVAMEMDWEAFDAMDIE